MGLWGLKHQETGFHLLKRMDEDVDKGNFECSDYTVSLKEVPNSVWQEIRI